MTDAQEVLRLLRKISDLAYDEDVGEPLDCAIDYANKAIAALAATPAVGGEPVAWEARWKGKKWDPVIEPTPDRLMRIKNVGREVRPLYAAQPAPTLRGRDELIEQCARIAEPWSGFIDADKMGASDNEVIKVRNDIAKAIRSLSASAPEQPAALRGRNELADKLLDRWDANENESNPLANGKCIRLWIAEIDAIHAALSAPEQPASPLRVRDEDWRDDPSSDERWNAGVDCVMKLLCDYLGVDPGAVTWDAATETVDGDISAVIGNILRTKYGEDWGPSDGAIYAAVSKAGMSETEHAGLMRDVDVNLGDLSASPPEQPECETEREAAIEECAALMRRWANDAAEQMASDPGCVIQHNVCRNAAVAISNLAKEAP